MAATMPGESADTGTSGSPSGRGQISGKFFKDGVLRDGLVFVVLCFVTVVLFGITLSLFRSFQQHREDLGREWSDRGRSALREGRPAEAVAALRTALSYQPDSWADQLALAQALAGAGRTDEATNYFLNLWEARPGDGFINLQLARLARRQGNAQEAVDHYRAAIFGNWQGDGVTRRREVRLELAEYLASRGDVSGAKVELLIAAGNAPEHQGLKVIFGDRLAAIGDFSDALSQYRQALKTSPEERAVLEKAGRAAYALGDYSSAHKLLSNAVAQAAGSSADEKEGMETRMLAGKAGRLLELRYGRDLAAVERADHLFLGSQIARQRLAACSAQLRPPAAAKSTVSAVAWAGMPPGLLSLETRWAAENKVLSRKALARDASAGDVVAELIADTERQTAELCGAPTGDDALLLMLSSPARGKTQQ